MAREATPRSLHSPSISLQLALLSAGAGPGFDGRIHGRSLLREKNPRHRHRARTLRHRAYCPGRTARRLTDCKRADIRAADEPELTCDTRHTLAPSAPFHRSQGTWGGGAHLRRGHPIHLGVPPSAEVLWAASPDRGRPSAAPPPRTCNAPPSRVRRRPARYLAASALGAAWNSWAVIRRSCASAMHTHPPFVGTSDS
jgi:hypothetical protein